MPEFPTLSILPAGKLLIYERPDDQHIKTLISHMGSSGVLRTPPVVACMPDNTGDYLILNGADWIVALKEMGVSHILAQVSEPDAPGLRLQTRNHIVWEMNARRFLENLRAIPGLRLVPQDSSEVLPDIMGDSGIAKVQTCEGDIYMACTKRGKLPTRLALLNSIVDSYQNRSRLDHTQAGDLHSDDLRLEDLQSGDLQSADCKSLAERYPSLCGLVVFPDFKFNDLARVARLGCLLPDGIACFTISPRALHLNYPLDELAADKPLEDKNMLLAKWVQERIAHRGVRYYAESTYLFNESCTR